MQFFSTRDQNRKVTSSEAIAQGLSNEGGLFVPESFPQVDVKALCELDYPAMAAAVIREYLTDYSQDFLTQATRSTYGDAFGGKAGYLAPVDLGCLMDSPEDLSRDYLTASCIRVLRFGALLTSLLLPGFYIALTVFHQQMIPL